MQLFAGLTTAHFVVCRYTSEMESYVPSAGFGESGLSLTVSPPAKGKQKKEKDKNAPKGIAFLPLVDVRSYPLCA